MNKRRSVLVLGEDTLSFLATIRSLGRYGVDVHVAWCPLDSPALQSRYVKQVHSIPFYRPDDPAWIAAFRNLLERHPFDLILPTTDVTILPLQLYRNEFEGIGKFCLLPDDVYRICADKDETHNLAVREQVPVPKQRVIHDVGEALECAKEFGYPVVLKPQRSAANSGVRHRVRKAANEHELLAWAEAMLGGHAVLAQENFSGQGVGVEVLCRDGRILTAFQHERVHEPMMGGGSSYRKSVALDEGMYNAASRLMKSLGYTGVAMVEFKRNSKTGRWVLIEINARFWGSLPLSIAAGLDFPRYLFQMLVEGREEFPRDYRTGIFSRHWSSDMQWFLSNLRADRSSELLQSRPLWSVALEAWNVITLRERSDTLVLDDPKPAWGDLKHFFEEKGFRLLKQMALYRENEHRRLIRHYREAKSVLVLCYGNICRSPFAERLLTKLAPGKAITSGGTYPKAGRASPAEGVAAAADFGIELASHRSRVVTAEELRSADLILVFDRQNWLAVRSLCPEVMPRVVFLGAADPTGQLEIKDPFGSEAEDFRTCYGCIKNLLERLEMSSVADGP